jgi:hypothetical protein
MSRDHAVAAHHDVLITASLVPLYVRASVQDRFEEDMHVVCLQDGSQQKSS